MARKLKRLRSYRLRMWSKDGSLARDSNSMLPDVVGLRRRASMWMRRSQGNLVLAFITGDDCAEVLFRPPEGGIVWIDYLRDGNKAYLMSHVNETPSVSPYYLNSWDIILSSHGWASYILEEVSRGRD